MFPSDVLAQILCRLPAKNICQLKTVSKQWLHTISTPHFKKLHYQKFKNKPHLVVIDESFQHNTTISTFNLNVTPTILDKKFSLDVHFQQHYTRFTFSLCLMCYSIRNSIWVYNLVTCQSLELPPLSTPLHGFELGYIPCSNEFKIVHCYWKKIDEKSCKTQYEIITLKDGASLVPLDSWRLLQHHQTATSDKGAEHMTSQIASLSVNGNIYWLVYDMVDLDRKFVCLNLEKEQLGTISCPKDSSITPKSLVIHQSQQLVEVKGFLGLAHFSDNFSNVNIFVLKQDECWVKEFSINLSNMGNWFKIVGYVLLEGEEENVGEILFVTHKSRPLLYNTQNGRFRHIGGRETNLFRSYQHNLCFDSLFCLGSKRSP